MRCFHTKAFSRLGKTAGLGYFQKILQSLHPIHLKTPVYSSTLTFKLSHYCKNNNTLVEFGCIVLKSMPVIIQITIIHGLEAT